MHFRQEKSPSTDYGTLFLYQKSFLVRTWFICSLRVSAVSLTVRSPWSVTALSAALFSFTAVREPAVYRTISNTVGLQRELRYCDRLLLVTLFCFDCQPFRLGQNSGQSFDQCFVFGLPFTFLLQTCFLHLNSSFINARYTPIFSASTENIFWTSFEVTKTKLTDNKRKAPIRPWMGAIYAFPRCFLLRKALWLQNMTQYISLFVFYTLQSLQGGWTLATRKANTFLWNGSLRLSF